MQIPNCSRKRKKVREGLHIFDIFEIIEHSFLYCSRIGLEAKNKSTAQYIQNCNQMLEQENQS